MKQRFLNQKLGKRMSRKVKLQKAKATLSGTGQGWQRTKSNPAGRKQQGSAPLQKAG